MKLIADNYYTDHSSCYFLDMRNSTLIVRTISLDQDSKSVKATERLKIHAEFMLRVHELLSSKLKGLDKDQYYFDDTGDGHFCLLWTKTHAWDILDIACTIARFLTAELKSYNAGPLQEWSNEINRPLKLDFGMGLHTGGSLIYEDGESKKKYAFGIVLNTASRVESYTKNYIDLSLLFTGNFKSCLQQQHEHLKKGDQRAKKSIFQKIKPASAFNIDIKDSRQDGHALYTILPQNIVSFITQ